MKRLFFFPLVLTLCAFHFSQADNSDPAVVQDLNVRRYMGPWYEVAHSPNYFQKNCERSTADYTLGEEGKIQVLNTCYKKDNKTSSIEGVAAAVDPAIPAKLKVDFGFFRRGDYWITKLDPDYQWAVVSGPKKKSIFILTRQAPMDAVFLKNLLNEMKEEGYRIDNLIFDKDP